MVDKDKVNDQSCACEITFFYTLSVFTSSVSQKLIYSVLHMIYILSKNRHMKTTGVLPRLLPGITQRKSAEIRQINFQWSGLRALFRLLKMRLSRFATLMAFFFAFLIVILLLQTYAPEN